MFVDIPAFTVTTRYLSHVELLATKGGSGLRTAPNQYLSKIQLHYCEMAGQRRYAVNRWGTSIRLSIAVHSPLTISRWGKAYGNFGSSAEYPRTPYQPGNGKPGKPKYYPNGYLDGRKFVDPRLVIVPADEFAGEIALFDEFVAVVDKLFVLL